ncbi:hypothetical protein CGZ93_13155 [Enemella dayhoffiae]|uniref:DUF2550 family protein n=1 Tax=Enemella dayhoffiae TaxID=2016507 RepID=A0A255GUE1_9ACTN|nr:DUF2550 domain-containing protein [Enemella dayhoffiae]OYO19319.1 hypothetical protein CGZ93_13155 [Enemella dayhoffiae]
MEWLVEVVGLTILLALIVPLLWLYLRRRWLSRQGGIFDCAMRPVEHTEWALGLARYEGEHLEWYRALSLSLRPKVRFRRTATSAVEQREAEYGEVESLYGNPRVVRLSSSSRVPRDPAGDWELAMAPESSTGLLSWLEAAPPSVGRFRQ